MHGQQNTQKKHIKQNCISNISYGVKLKSQSLVLHNACHKVFIIITNIND